MKKLFILTLFLISGCSSQVMVENYEADFESQKSIYDVEYNTGERTPIQLATLSITKDIITQYP